MYTPGANRYTHVNTPLPQTSDHAQHGFVDHRHPAMAHDQAQARHEHHGYVESYSSTAAEIARVQHAPVARGYRPLTTTAALQRAHGLKDEQKHVRTLEQVALAKRKEAVDSRSKGATAKAEYAQGQLWQRKADLKSLELLAKGRELHANTAQTEAEYYHRSQQRVKPQQITLAKIRVEHAQIVAKLSGEIAQCDERASKLVARATASKDPALRSKASQELQRYASLKEELKTANAMLADHERMAERAQSV